MSTVGPLELLNTAAIIVVLFMSLLSLYFSRLQGAKIKAIDIREQTPLATAYHTIILTNYGNKTGVVIGPDLKSEVEMEVGDKSGDSVTAIEPHGMVIKKVEVHYDGDENKKYHLEFQDQKGRTIKLPEATYLNKLEKKEK